MKAQPQLSVIVPTYNRAALLRKALESILRQTYSDLEIIVVDDGSTDHTKDVIAQLLKEENTQTRRIRYFFQRNQGKSVALNYGVSEAKGEWIAFQDSDDLWLPDKIEMQFQALRQYAPRSQACFTNAQFINNPFFQGTAFQRARKHYCDTTGVLGSPVEHIGKFWIYMQSILVHSTVMAKVGEFDPAFWTGQDEDFVFRLSLHTIMCYVNLPLVLIDCTPRREDRLTAKRSRRDFEVLKLRQLRYEKWLRLSEGLGADIQTTLREHLRGVHSEQANWLLVNRRYGEARRAAALAARTEFTPGIAAKWCLAAVAPAVARRIILHRSRNVRDCKMPGASDVQNDSSLLVSKEPS